MESRSNYRIVIDLSKYFNDARRLSCVYTNEKSMSHIVHLKERISSVFKIPGEFHLVAVVAGTEVYLPPNEDIRIIEEEEVIQVVPGSGVDDFLLWKDMAVKHDGKPLEAVQVTKNPENVSVRVTKSQNEYKNSVPFIKQNGTGFKLPVNNEKKETIVHKFRSVEQENRFHLIEVSGIDGKTHKVKKPITRPAVKNTEDIWPIENKNTIKDINDLNGETSVPDDDSFLIIYGEGLDNQEKISQTSTPSSVVIPRDQSITIVESCSESESEQSTATNKNESSDVSGVSRRKRKRIRKRKPKKTAPEKSAVNYGTVDWSKDWCPAKSGPSKPKHTKFDWEDDTEEKKNNGVPDLRNLFSLKHAPVTTVFTGKILVDGGNEENDNFEAAKDFQIQNDKENEKINNSKDLIPDLLKINPLDYPICNSVFQENDFIAFRVLKIGEDYTPGISGNIIAEVLKVDSTAKTYELKLLTGKDQLKEPEGKFSLEQIDDDDDDEMKVEKGDAPAREVEIIETMWSELIEPRLIFRLSS